MSSGWKSSTRRRTLPPGWARIRRRILTRDRHLCQLRGPHCTGRATDVDHIGDRHDHRDTNLRAACRRCHATRSARQGQAASAAARRVTRAPERHPGLSA